MSRAIELDTNEVFPSEQDQPLGTGVFRAPAALTQTSPSNESAQPATLAAMPYREARKLAIEAFEHEYISALLARCGGNVTHCARTAGLDRVYLHRLLNKHGLRGSQPRARPVKQEQEEAPKIEE